MPTMPDHSLGGNQSPYDNLWRRRGNSFHNNPSIQQQPASGPVVDETIIRLSSLYLSLALSGISRE